MKIGQKPLSTIAEKGKINLREGTKPTRRTDRPKVGFLKNIYNNLKISYRTASISNKSPQISKYEKPQLKAFIAKHVDVDYQTIKTLAQRSRNLADLKQYTEVIGFKTDNISQNKLVIDTLARKGLNNTQMKAFFALCPEPELDHLEKVSNHIEPNALKFIKEYKGKITDAGIAKYHEAIPYFKGEHLIASELQNVDITNIDRLPAKQRVAFFKLVMDNPTVDLSNIKKGYNGVFSIKKKL